MGGAGRLGGQGNDAPPAKGRGRGALGGGAGGGAKPAGGLRAAPARPGECRQGGWAFRGPRAGRGVRRATRGAGGRGWGLEVARGGGQVGGLELDATKVGNGGNLVEIGRLNAGQEVQFGGWLAGAGAGRGPRAGRGWALLGSGGLGQIGHRHRQQQGSSPQRVEDREGKAEAEAEMGGEEEYPVG